MNQFSLSLGLYRRRAAVLGVVRVHLSKLYWFALSESTAAVILVPLCYVSRLTDAERPQVLLWACFALSAVCAWLWYARIVVLFVFGLNSLVYVVLARRPVSFVLSDPSPPLSLVLQV